MNLSLISAGPCLTGTVGLSLARRNGLILAGSQLHLLRLNGSTLKANIVGIGDYINNISTDVGRLAKTFEKYVQGLSGNATLLAKNLTRVEAALDKETAALRNGLHSVQQISAHLKGQVGSLGLAFKTPR